MDWRESDINVDSLWLIDERGKEGKHSNVYHGNFIPQIPYQLIKRYTSEGDTVMELFSGSGTTLYECENQKRNYIGYDINEEIISYVEDKMKDTTEIKYVLNNCDVTDSLKFDEAFHKSSEVLGVDSVDLLIAHPPYMDIVKFTDKDCDLSSIADVDTFIEKLLGAFKNAWKFLKKKGYFAVVMGDVYKKSEVIPLAFYTMNAIKQNFNVKMKGVVIKNIEGNRGKLGAQNIWKYRALKSDYFLFKHEYIFVFKKEK